MKRKKILQPRKVVAPKVRELIIEYFENNWGAQTKCAKDLGINTSDITILKQAGKAREGMPKDIINWIEKQKS